MKKTICVMGLIFILITGFIIAVPVSNNLVAKSTSKELARTALPDQTEYIESVSLAGKLTGNGNGMQYFGAILIKSGLSLENLHEYYSAFSDNNYEYVVAKQTDKDINIIEHGHLSFSTDISSDDYYIVYSWKRNVSLFSELFGDLDLRAH